MPISKYFGGHGAEVMRGMKREYGPKKGESVFYATANKEHQKPAQDMFLDRFGEGVNHHTDSIRELKKRLSKVERASGSLKPEALAIAKQIRDAIALHEFAKEAWGASDRAWKQNDPEAGNYEDGASDLSNQANRASAQVARIADEVQPVGDVASHPYVEDPSVRGRCLKCGDRKYAHDAALQGDAYKMVTRLSRELGLSYGEVAAEWEKNKSSDLRRQYELTRSALMREVQPVTDARARDGLFAPTLNQASKLAYEGEHEAAKRLYKRVLRSTYEGSEDYERAKRELAKLLTKKPAKDSTGGIQPGDTVKHTWPDSDQGYNGRKISAGEWRGTVEACSGPMCKVRRDQFRDTVYVPAELLQRVGGRGKDAAVCAACKKGDHIDCTGRGCSCCGEWNEDAKPADDGVNYKFAEPSAKTRPVQSVALRPEEVKAVYEPKSAEGFKRTFGKDYEKIRGWFPGGANKPICPMCGSDQVEIHSGGGPSASTTRYKCLECGHSKGTHSAKDVSTNTPTSLSEKTDHFRVGTPVYHATGKQGVVHSNVGGKLIVATNVPGSVPEEWDARRTFTRAEDVNKPKPVRVNPAPIPKLVPVSKKKPAKDEVQPV